MPDEQTTYTSLAAILALAGTLALVLWRWHGPVVDGEDGEEAVT